MAWKKQSVELTGYSSVESVHSARQETGNGVVRSATLGAPRNNETSSEKSAERTERKA